jgi:hypothetical protein
MPKYKKLPLYDELAIMLQEWNDYANYTPYDIIHTIALIGYKIGALEGRGALLTKEQEEFIKDANLYEYN